MVRAKARRREEEREGKRVTAIVLALHDPPIFSREGAKNAKKKERRPGQSLATGPISIVRHRQGGMPASPGEDAALFAFFAPAPAKAGVFA